MLDPPSLAPGIYSPQPERIEEEIESYRERAAGAGGGSLTGRKDYPSPQGRHLPEVRKRSEMQEAKPTVTRKMLKDERFKKVLQAQMYKKAADLEKKDQIFVKHSQFTSKRLMARVENLTDNLTSVSKDMLAMSEKLPEKKFKSFKS